jgi:hypothetical protein
MRSPEVERFSVQDVLNSRYALERKKRKNI